MLLFWDRYGAHDFFIFHNRRTVPPAMFAQLEAHFPAMNLAVDESIARVRNTPPPAQPDPNSRKFWRVHCDWSVDTDLDGSPDWAEFEMATLATGGPSDPLRADAFNGDTNGNATPDGEELDADGDGTPDANDVNLDDGTAAYQLGPLPRYAVFPITNAQPSSDTYHAKNARQISDKGTVLYLNGTWTGGTWTPLSGNGPDGSASALSINDHNVIVGVRLNQIEAGDRMIDVSTGCWWPAPIAAPQLISTSDGTDTYDPSADSMDWLAESMHCGPLLSNDGKFLMAANHVEDGTYQWSHHALWQLPAQTGQSVPASSADRGLRYNQSPDLWGSDETNSMGVVSQGLTVSNPSRSPVNVAQLPGGLLLAMTPWPDSPAEVLHQGAWQPATTYSPAIDLSSDGTAIGKSDNQLTAPILLNGRWTGIEKYLPTDNDALDPPFPWHANSVTLLDTTPSGWVLADRGVYPDEYAVMLPIRAEGYYVGSHGIALTEAVGVDDFSIGSDTPGVEVQDRIWIMAPQGGVNKVVNFKAPLNANTPLTLMASNILFSGQDNVTLSGAVNPVSLSASDAVLSGGERLMALSMGSGNNELLSPSKPIGLKIMKSRTVNVTVYQVTKLYGTSAEEPVDSVMMPTEKEIEDHLNDLFRPQINTVFNVNLEAEPLTVRWDDDANAAFDIQTGNGDPGEEAAILAAVPANAPAYDVRVFLVANRAAPLGSGVNSYGLTLRDERTCWVHGSRFGKNRSKPFLLDTIAHEIGHVFVGAGHPDQDSNSGPAPLPGTKHVCRLMCSGPNSDGSSRLLVKKEWDEAEKWLNVNIKDNE